MPYKDPAKRREVERRSREKKKRLAGQVDLQEEQVNFKGRPTVEDAEAIYGDEQKEASLAKLIMRRYMKSRTWACIMYLDSMPADWEDRLRQIGVGFAVSPLHDRDVRDTGELKKEHYHVILDWPGGTTTYRTAAGIARDVLQGTIPIPLVSPRGYYRYFTHLDNPKKAQYDEADIVRGNGFDIDEFAALTSAEQAEIRKGLYQLIQERNFLELWDLTGYVACFMPFAYDEYLSRNTIMVQGWLSSRRNSMRSRPAVPAPASEEVS